jgi:hypothetical protein
METSTFPTTTTENVRDYNALQFSLFQDLLGVPRGRFLSIISSTALGYGFCQLERKRLGH